MKTRSVVLSFFLAAAAGGVAVADDLTGVPTANPKSTGVSAPNVLSPELVEVAAVQGSNPVENPSASTHFYGYLNDHPNMVPALNSNVEATKTEPDKNTYLVLEGLTGADPDYDYGTHFLFQGHELGAPGTITRINLDADAAHRVTLLANFEADGVTPLPAIDGSTWYPWAQRLLFSQEGNGTSNGGIWQATLDVPSVVENLAGVLGHGGYEGIQADSDGNIWIAEDIGGSTVAGARLPNSFIYRFQPKNRHDLEQGGRLQALQVLSRLSGQPIVFQTASALTQDIQDLHTYGLVFDTRWVTVHDTATDGFAPFNANALARTAAATPFKRPENGQFRPGTGFGEFFFDETGDTSSTSTANAAHGGWGSILKLVQSRPSASTGKLSLFFRGDLEHASFDNCAFWDEDHIVFVEDRGDGLHASGNALDSAWMFDARRDYSNRASHPLRLIAEGRDPSATIDSGLQGTPGFQNEGDNEITGFHVSDGDPSPNGLLGAQRPHPFHDGWRVFYTAQHGDNVTWEILRSRGGDDEDDHDRGHDHDR
jgi:uncharacterized protein DUF839